MNMCILKREYNYMVDDCKQNCGLESSLRSPITTLVKDVMRGTKRRHLPEVACHSSIAKRQVAKCSPVDRMSDEQRVRNNTVENMLSNDKEKSSRPKYLSDTQIQEVRDCSLKYINLMFNEKYTDMSLFYMDTFNWGHKAKRKEFVVSFMLMLSASEKHKNKSIIEIMGLEIGFCDMDEDSQNEIVSLIESERKSLLTYGCEESIHDYYDEYIDNIQNSIKYFENKLGWKTGGDDDGHLPLLSRGAFMHDSKNKEIYDIVDKKLSSLHKEIGSAPENDKITAICNYVMEKANHEILYSNSREYWKGFNDDNWSPAAIKESGMVFAKANGRYANEKKVGGKEEYKPGSFLGSFGNCDHFTGNAINTLNSIDLDQRYDFGHIFSDSSDKDGHAVCYLHDTVAKKIMVVDPWMNVYYDLENHEHFFGQYLEEKFTVDMTSLRTDRDSVIDDIVGSNIRNGIKYSGSVFSEHLKAHYKSI